MDRHRATIRHTRELHGNWNSSICRVRFLDTGTGIKKGQRYRDQISVAMKTFINRDGLEQNKSLRGPTGIGIEINVCPNEAL